MFHRPLLMMIGLFLLVEVTCSMSPQFKYKLERYIGTHICYISLILAVSAALELVFKRFQIPIPQSLFILVIGYICGTIGRYWGVISTGTLFTVPSPYMMILALPSFVMKTSFSVDAHTYFRSWSQILIISVPGVLVTGTTTGLIMFGMMKKTSWTYTSAIIFGTLCTPIYPFELVKSLKDLGQHTKYVVNLLEGESIFGLCTVILVWDIAQVMYSGEVTEVEGIACVGAWKIGGGAVLGLIIGKLICWIIDILYGNTKNIILWTIGATYFTFYACKELFESSGALALIIVAFLISIHRPALSIEVDTFLGHFWEFSASIITNLLLYTNGVWTATAVFDWTEAREYGLLLVTTCVTVIIRFIVFVIMGPILGRLGYGITWSNLLILAWGGQKSIIPICLMSHLISESTKLPFYYQTYVHITALLFFSLLIQVTLTPYLLKILGIAEISPTRRRNMNICIKHIQYRQTTAINCLKMEKFLSDCNWPKVHKATMMRNPYEETAEISNSDTDFYEYRTTVCPECDKEVVEDPSPEVLQEMTREARVRILKAQRISILRQYENGMLSRDGRRMLLAAIHIAADSEDALIDVTALGKRFTRKDLSYRIKVCLVTLLRTKPITVRKPNNYIKRKCYHIANSLVFKIFMFVVIFINAVGIVVELIFDFKIQSTEHVAMSSVNIIFFLIYTFEFYVLVYGYSRDGIQKGLLVYFRSWWNIFDFIVLLCAAADVIIFIIGLLGIGKVTYQTRVASLIRILRFLRLFQPCYPRLRRYYDSKIDDHVAFAYEIGKSFVDAQSEVIDKLPHIIDNKTIRLDMINRLEQDKATIVHQLGIVQKERPWITITVKTKQAMRTTLFNMREAVNELKLAGWMDDFEHEKLNASLAERLKFVYAIRSVQSSEPRMIFKEVPWMGHDEIIIDFLYNNVRSITFDTGDHICTQAYIADGIYIIVTGLLKLTYTPRKDVLNRLTKYGVLPVADYVTNVSYTNPIEDYLVCGNSVGELSTLTGRPYNCNIVAETPSQVYLIPRDIVREALNLDSDIINGLECRIWKALAIRIGLSILLDVPAYNMMTMEKIKMALERSLIPRLTEQKFFQVNDMIEDIILIEGIVRDANVTDDMFIAPCYVPRTVKVIEMNVLEGDHIAEPKLLIIPVKDVDEYDLLLAAADQITDFGQRSSKNLQHKESGYRGRHQKITTAGIFSFENETANDEGSEELENNLYTS